MASGSSEFEISAPATALAPATTATGAAAPVARAGRRSRFSRRAILRPQLEPLAEGGVFGHQDSGSVEQLEAPVVHEPLPTRSPGMLVQCAVGRLRWTRPSGARAIVLTTADLDAVSRPVGTEASLEVPESPQPPSADDTELDARSGEPQMFWLQRTQAWCSQWYIYLGWAGLRFKSFASMVSLFLFCFTCESLMRFGFDIQCSTDWHW